MWQLREIHVITLKNPTTQFNTIPNRGQISVWFCFAKGEKYMKELYQFYNFDKSMSQLWQIQQFNSASSHARVISIKSPQQEKLTQGRTRQGNDRTIPKKTCFKWSKKQYKVGWISRLWCWWWWWCWWLMHPPGCQWQQNRAAPITRRQKVKNSNCRWWPSTLQGRGAL